MYWEAIWEPEHLEAEQGDRQAKETELSKHDSTETRGTYTKLMKSNTEIGKKLLVKFNYSARKCLGGDSPNCRHLLREHLNFLVWLRSPSTSWASLVLWAAQGVQDCQYELWIFCLLQIPLFYHCRFFVGLFFRIVTERILLTELQQVKRKLTALAVFPDTLCVASDCIPISPTAVLCSAREKYRQQKNHCQIAKLWAAPWLPVTHEKWGEVVGDLTVTLVGQWIQI